MDWSTHTVSIDKLIRWGLVALIFIGITSIYKMDSRLSQEILFQLFMMSVLIFIVENIWISLFMCLTIFLFIYYKFSIGQGYVSNIFLGSLLYYVVKKVFSRETTRFFINGFLVFTCLNLAFMLLQRLNLDFINYMGVALDSKKQMSGFCMMACGLMGFNACMGMLCAFAIPIVMIRRTIFSKICAILLFIPLYLTDSSICVAAGVIGFIYMIYFECKTRFQKIILLLLSILLFSCAGYYTLKIDNTDSSIKTRIYQWKLVLNDCTVHPLTGWGLDSFRKVTPTKAHIYALRAKEIDKVNLNVDVWDNPHNLYVSILFEWGILGFILLLGYICRLVRLFRNSIKNNMVIGLSGFIVVFFLVSMAQFPLFLAKCAVFIIPMFALFEVNTTEMIRRSHA